MVQGSLRQGMLGTWEYVFPEESLGDVVSAMELNLDVKFLGLRTLAIRKALKLKKIPKKFIDINGQEVNIKGLQKTRVLLNHGVSVYPIGIRRDPRKEVDWGAPGKYEQEML